MVKKITNNGRYSAVGKWLALIVFSATTLAFHYGLFGHSLAMGDLFRRLCYIPILLGAFWFGIGGGLGMAAGISVAVIPHISMMSKMHGDVAGEVVEIFFYLLLGGMFGLLVERERAIERARQESERKLARAEHLSSLGEMASRLAHEIKNPLGSIRGAAEILIPALPSGDKKREFGDILISEVNRLNGVVEHFLQYARPRELRPDRFPLREFLAAIFRQLEFSARDNGVQITLTMSGDVMLTADSERLKQVFLNLGLNAIKAMPNGGRLDFRVEDRAGGVAIIVSDTGRGIPLENLEKIFNPFFTTDSAGSGLGLAIVERIITEHDGHIKVESALGKGTSFVITLPDISSPTAHSLQPTA